MPERIPFGSDPFSILHRRLDDAFSQINRINNNSYPIIPTYDWENPPQDAIEGQIALFNNAPGISSGTTTREQLASSTDLVLNTGSQDFLYWDGSYLHTGDVLDVTDPQHPVVKVAGIYAVSITVKGAALDTGGCFTALLSLDHTNEDATVQQYSPLASAFIMPLFPGLQSVVSPVIVHSNKTKNKYT